MGNSPYVTKDKFSLEGLGASMMQERHERSFLSFVVKTRGKGLK